MSPARCSGAEIAELASCLALTARVHREKHGIFRSVRMHAPRPIAEVIGVANLASGGIEQLLAAQVTRGLGGGCTAARERDDKGKRVSPPTALVSVH